MIFMGIEVGGTPWQGLLIIMEGPGVGIVGPGVGIVGPGSPAGREGPLGICSSLGVE